MVIADLVSTDTSGITTWSGQASAEARLHHGVIQPIRSNHNMPPPCTPRQELFYRQLLLFTSRMQRVQRRRVKYSARSRGNAPWVK
jgi:hypothetical protein